MTTSMEPTTPSSSPREKRRQPALLARVITAVTGPWTWRNVKAWLVVIGVVLILRWVWFDQFKIPTGSMEPTLHGNPAFLKGDRVSINKFIYGHRFPLNDFRIPFTDKTIHYADRRIWRGAEPQRWDIVVFKTVEEDNPGKTLIKRVVGLPGERIHIANGNVHVDGKRVEPPGGLRDILHYTAGTDDRDVRRFILQLANLEGPPNKLNPNHAGARKLILALRNLHEKLAGKDVDGVPDEKAQELLSDTDPVAFQVAREMLDMQHAELGTFRYGIRSEGEYAVVPEDCYFVLGDNSRQSRDGRSFGWVPNEHIMGRAFCIWWPIPRWRDFSGFSNTWWGKVILYGILGLVIGYELTRFCPRKRTQNRKGDSTKPIEPAQEE